MKLIEIKLGNGDWRNIRPQLDEESYYLIKVVDKHFNHGRISYYCSRIEKAGWLHYQHESPDTLDRPHSWEYGAGSHSSSFESSSTTYFISEEIVGIWRIDDPDYYVTIAKAKLNE